MSTFTAIVHKEENLYVAECPQVVRRLEEVDKLSDHDKATIKEILDAFILQNLFQRLACAQNSQAGDKKGQSKIKISLSATL